MSKRSHKRKKRTQGKQGSIRHKTAPPPSRDERVLRERILKFAYQKRFKNDFEIALQRYFGEGVSPDDTPSINENQIPAFQEWYFHDYVTSEGEPIIDLLANEMGSRLPAAQRQMLDDWRRTNRYRLCEVQALEPGIGITVKDLLSGETLQVNDVSFSYSLAKWHIGLFRPLLTQGRMCFAGSAIPLPPKAKLNLLGYARELWKEYQDHHPRALLGDFYRDHGLDLYHRAVEITAAPLPSVYTPEGHLFEPSTARYTVTHPEAIEALLDQTEEFLCVGPADEDKSALAYVWVLAGRSQVPEIAIEGEGLIMESNFVIEGNEEEPLCSLGDVRLWPSRLELSCVSRERLQAGKALLAETLGHLIQHQGDEHKDIETLLESAESYPPPRRKPASKQEDKLLRQMMLEHHERWLDEPIPALGGMSPRQASRVPNMREQLEELLKSVEYIEEKNRREGLPYINIADIRRDLGLPTR